MGTKGVTFVLVPRGLDVVAPVRSDQEVRFVGVVCGEGEGGRKHVPALVKQQLVADRRQIVEGRLGRGARRRPQRRCPPPGPRSGQGARCGRAGAPLWSDHDCGRPAAASYSTSS